ncbi:hypothetical protein MSTE_01724 [Mycobacteroides stephanolepidis]|uniref:Uncharacterized protein n=1 Tax=[Mycobacterium] stephanolepidis TaxID=1520670 RepID=A0A1Z4EVS2_9MYCO|nr:hypothetical protein MSTE_01724 [[Mycobacterium] stephanolepidis]
MRGFALPLTTERWIEAEIYCWGKYLRVSLTRLSFRRSPPRPSVEH